MKTKIIFLVLVPLLFLGCSDLFDKGDVEKVYDGPAVVEFKPLLIEGNLADGSVTVEIQLIGEQRGSDLPVSFNVDGSSTAVEGTHYTIATPSPVTLSSGTSAVDVTLNLIENSLEPGQNVRVYLNLEGGPDVPAEETLNRSEIVIQG